MKSVKITDEIPVRGSYDVVVAGGGVAGVAAALTARERGCRVLLIEKSCLLGGLATMGLVNLFVPMCNGRGRQVIFGLADKWIDECAQYGYETMPEEWKHRKNGVPSAPTEKRLTQHYSPYIFALQMTEMIREKGVDLLFDCAFSEPVMDGNVCRGIVTESKSGREYIEAKMFIDTTGDADLLRRAGVPTVKGKNFHTYAGKMITLDSCRKAVETGDIGKAIGPAHGGSINLYGKNQPEDIPQWSGTTVDEVTDYYLTEQREALRRVCAIPDKNSRDIVTLPMMPNFRTTCRIDGDHTFTENDAYRHFDDSVCAICDFDRRDLLYEIPLRCLTKKGYPNLITAGRSISASGYGWDVVRVIPPAILTGQAAGEACALALESGRALSDVEIAVLQARLEEDHILIHFPDEWVPSDPTGVEDGHTEGHI